MIRRLRELLSVAPRAELDRLGTELASAREALRRAEFLLRQAQRLSGSGSYSFDAGTGQLAGAPEHLSMFGFEPAGAAPCYEELLLRIHPEDRAAVVHDIEQAVLARADFVLRCRIVLPDASFRHVHALGHCCFEETGNPHEYIGSVVDVTQQSAGEEEQRKLAALIAHSADFIALASPAGQVLFVNPAGKKLVGLGSDDEMRGTVIYDYLFAEDRAFVEAEMLSSAMQDGGWRGELRFRHFATGAPIPMLVNCFFIKEPGTGRKVALATISRDISERKQREETLREYEKVVEGLEEGITVLDRDYRYRRR